MRNSVFLLTSIFRIASASLKAAIASTIEAGIQLKVGGFECELIALISEAYSSSSSGASSV